MTSGISSCLAYFWGNVAEAYPDLFTSKQKFSVGSFLDFVCPVVPWITFRLTFMYAGPGGEWFKFNL